MTHKLPTAAHGTYNLTGKPEEPTSSPMSSRVTSASEWTEVFKLTEPHLGSPSVRGVWVQTQLPLLRGVPPGLRGPAVAEFHRPSRPQVVEAVPGELGAGLRL